MRNIFVSYDLHQPGQNYGQVTNAIKQMGNWAKVQYSLYYLRTYRDSAAIADFVWRHMDANDSLIVVDASTNAAEWRGKIDPSVAQFMSNSWRAAA
jgi:CRISPR/Cas system-associated endoribonuclease Cas2